MKMVDSSIKLMVAILSCGILSTFLFHCGMTAEQNAPKLAIEPGELSCIQFAKNMLNLLYPTVMECIKQVQFANSTFKARNIREFVPCFAKCLGIKMKLLNQNGTMNLDNAIKFITETVPKRFLDIVWEIWKTCEDDLMLMKEGQENCEIYRAGLKCFVMSELNMIMDSFINLCPDVPDFAKKTVKDFVHSKSTMDMLNTIFQ